MSDQQTLEKSAIEQLLNNNLKEQRSSRRWGIFFKLAFLFYLIITLWILYPNESLTTINKSKPHTSLIDIKGELDDSAQSNADNVATSLEAAFHDSNTKGIIIRINSPGGSAVQAAYIYDEIIRLEKKYPTIKVYAVCTDVCASAAYYIASAAQEIYVNPASIVGSIGVLMEGFGFVNTMNKLGVERRLFTAGEHKGFLDPYSPLKPSDPVYVQQMLNIVHAQFIKAVQDGRGTRLKNNIPDLFSGLAWTGRQAYDFGLVDGFGSPGFVARTIIKNETIVDYTVKPSYVDIIANKIGASFAQRFSSDLGINRQMRATERY
jgi:protease-4